MCRTAPRPRRSIVESARMETHHRDIQHHLTPHHTTSRLIVSQHVAVQESITRHSKAYKHGVGSAARRTAARNRPRQPLTSLPAVFSGSRRTVVFGRLDAKRGVPWSWRHLGTGSLLPNPVQNVRKTRAEPRVDRGEQRKQARSRVHVVWCGELRCWERDMSRLCVCACVVGLQSDS